MHDLNSGHPSTFHRRRRRCGAPFRGRFKAVLAEDGSHALELTRHVHLNPVRAGIVSRPEAIYLARRLTDEAAGAIGTHFGGVSAAAVSKAVARAERRREEDGRWDAR